jgi:cell division protein FtsI/penicillin-binding protein 2
VTGFFPYKNPKYAFAIVMEKGSVHNLIGAVAVMKELADWMSTNTPEYFN